jgi:predicted PurR-regulated permease PerM
MVFDFKRIALIGVSLLILFLIFYFFGDILTYVLIAWVISMIGAPMFDFFLKHIKLGNRIRISRTLASVLTLIIFIIVATFIFWIFVPLIIHQANNLANVQYEQIYSALEEPIAFVNGKLMDIGVLTQDEIGTNDFTKILGQWFEPASIANYFGTLFGLAGSFLIGFFSVLFIAFFFLKESNLFNNFIVALVPSKYENDTIDIINDITKLLRNYLGGVLLQVTIITIFVSIFLSIFGIQNGLLIGFFAAMINVIPYVGPAIGALFGMIITISANLNLDFYTGLLPMLTKVAIVFASMQMLDNFILQPFIYSKSVKAHPLEIFLVILIAAKLGGILGMILAIPSYTVIRVVAREFLYQFKIVQKMTNSLDKIK